MRTLKPRSGSASKAYTQSRRPRRTRTFSQPIQFSECCCYASEKLNKNLIKQKKKYKKKLQIKLKKKLAKEIAYFEAVREKSVASVAQIDATTITVTTAEETFFQGPSKLAVRPWVYSRLCICERGRARECERERQRESSCVRVAEIVTASEAVTVVVYLPQVQL